jgi:hypothetical protein
MNSDDLRGALAQGAANQPPPSPNMRDGVDRAVRRQRKKLWLAAAPAALLVFVAGAAIGAAQRDTTTLDTVSDPTAPTTVDDPNEDQSAANTTATTVDDAPAPSGEPSATTPATEPEEGTPVASGGDCGTITVDSPGFDHLPDEPTAPLECFAHALDDDVEATLTVVTDTPDGSMTAVLTSASGHRVNLAMTGEINADLPDLPSIIGSWLPDDDDHTPANCEVEFPVGDVGWDSMGDVDFEAVGCLFDALVSGDGGTVIAHLTDDDGGDLTMTMTIDDDGNATVKSDGSVTVEVPEDVLPEQLLDLIPSEFGIDGSSFDELDSLGDLGHLGCDDANEDNPPWCD